MNPKTIAAISGGAIVVIVIITFAHADTYQKKCLDEGGIVTGFLSCAKVYRDFAEPPIIEKAKQLGIDNIMEAIDSDDLSYDEKKEYIKLNYEQGSNNITTLNLRMKDFPRELKDGEQPTFTLIESGYANTCTAPKLEVYLIKEERGLYNYDEDEPIYEEQVIIHPCPKFEQYFPVLNYRTEKDFPSFPACSYKGTHIIVGDSGTERHTLEEYFCNGSKEYEPSVP